MTGRVLDPRRWGQLAECFDQALELDAEGRRALLDSLGDEALRTTLQRMLAADMAAGPLDTQGRSAVHAHLERALDELDGDADMVGRRIGAWRVERLLGRGSMGRVYLAARDDGEFEQSVALKMLGTAGIDDLARRRFLEERRVLAKLSHPNIARLYDGGLGPGGEPWYAMEYIDGATLVEACDARRLSVAARLDLFCKVCDAVDYAHRHLVIHRDIKPGNILVDAASEPKLLDFGIAKLLEKPGGNTCGGTRVMTPEYAAPEQLRGEPVGIAADIYALGVVLFELLTGQRPFPDPLAAREPPSAVRACAPSSQDIQARAAVRGVTPKALRRQLHGDLERILRTVLDPDPSRRYASAAALSADLRRHLRGRPISVRHDRGYRIGKFLRRHRVGTTAAGMALLALVAALAFSLVEMRHARIQARTAQAVSDFMVNVFASADPDLHPGTPPNARELLDAGAQRLSQRFSDNPGITEALSQALARSYAGIGEHGKALRFASQALQAAIRAHGADSKQAIAARTDYAEMLHAADKEHEAIRQAGQVLALTGDDASRESVRAHLVIATASQILDDTARAAKEAHHALTLAGKLPGNTDLLKGEAWNQLARADLAQGGMQAAQPALRNVVALFTRARGADATETLDARRTLIFVLLHSGHPEEAVSMYAKLIASERRVLGSTHPRLVTDQGAYAYVLWHTGHYRQARQATAAVEALLDRELGKPEAARWYDGSYMLAIVDLDSGNLSRAQHVIDLVRPLITRMKTDAGREGHNLEASQAAIDIDCGKPGASAHVAQLIKTAPSDGRMVAWETRLDIPRGFRATGNFIQALRAYRDLENRLSSDPETRAAHLASLQLGEGIVLTELGRYAEARPKLDAALAAFTKPDQVLQANTARLWRGWLAVRSGHAAKSLPDIEAALAWRRMQLGDDSWLTGEAELADAEALSELGRKRQALAEQATARHVLAAQLLPTNILLQRAQQPLPR
jgi:serine/threonine-protein kinase